MIKDKHLGVKKVYKDDKTKTTTEVYYTHTGKLKKVVTSKYPEPVAVKKPKEEAPKKRGRPKKEAVNG